MTTTAPSPAIVVTNPADGSVVGSVPDASAEEVRRVVDELRIYQPAWEEIGAQARGVWLGRLRDWLLDHESEIADTLQSEAGKARAEAEAEAPMICELINYYSKNAAAFLTDERIPSSGALTAQKKLVKVYRPYPVVGIITPWNFPFAMPGMDCVPALAAGAAVVIKPSEVTPLSAQLLERAWTEIGAPPVLRVVTGLGATGAALVDAVDYIQFTGSTRTGKAIGAHAAGLLKPYSLELGGKDPALVLADADLDRAVNGIAWGGLMNSGQVCVSIERVYVEAPVYDEFVAKLAAKVNSLRQGQDDATYKQDVGALATLAQQQIVDGHVQAAVAEGARVLTGGKVGATGTFYEPTVLVDVNQSMACMREETFGPTIPVMKVADAEEGIRLANDSPYGLSATVWTSNLKRGEGIARRLDAGAVNVNDAIINLLAFSVPHGGWKESGVGARFGGANGVRKYCRTQVVTVPRMKTMKNEMNWYPYKARRAGLSGRVMRLIVARDARRRFSRRPPKA
ncbi:aldehyde dehydrogenase family protein [Jatrophihabitans sp.]|uniref:aldehyde dehydrogenase family protein n=1 Tax=Jatrophihabitans sp. TaxID=1932789 RepID=UPI0030C782D0|nr:aldehyde dehydrogenase [Jatrophihabitans sp.]